MGFEGVGFEGEGFGFVLDGVGLGLVEVVLGVGEDEVVVGCVRGDVVTGGGAASRAMGDGVRVRRRGVGLVLVPGVGVIWSRTGTPWRTVAGAVRAATPAPATMTSRAEAAASTVRARLGRSGEAWSSMTSAPDEGR